MVCNGHIHGFTLCEKGVGYYRKDLYPLLIFPHYWCGNLKKNGGKYNYTF